MSQLREQAARLKPSLAAGALQAVWPLVVSILLGLIMFKLIGPWSGGFASKVMLVAGINIVLAVSLTIVNGFTGQFSMGHAGFMAVGGYAAAMIVYYGSMRLWGTADFVGGALSNAGDQAFFTGSFIGNGDWLFIVACLVGGIFAAIAGYIVGLPSLRLRGDYLAIVTLGFGEIVRVLLQGTPDQIQPWKAATAKDVPLYKLPLMLGGPKGFNLLPIYTTLFWVYLAVGLTLILVYRLKISSSGRAFLSIREDEVAAQAMGVDITKYKVRAFVLSSFIAGVAGALYGLDIGAISATELGFQKSFDIIIMVVLGGMGSISGATLAAIILTILPELLRDPPPIWPAGAFVLLVMIIVQAIRKRWNVVSLLNVAGVVAALEIGRQIFAAHDGAPGDRSPVWPWGAAVLLGILVAQTVRRHWNYVPIVVVSLVTAVLEILRRKCVAEGGNLAEYRLVIYALMLILMMILRPEGLFGVNEIWDYLGLRTKKLAKRVRRSQKGAAA